MPVPAFGNCLILRDQAANRIVIEQVRATYVVGYRLLPMYPPWIPTCWKNVLRLLYIDLANGSAHV